MSYPKIQTKQKPKKKNETRDTFLGGQIGKVWIKKLHTTKNLLLVKIP